jgi:hypothetical protein
MFSVEYYIRAISQTIYWLSLLHRDPDSTLVTSPEIRGGRTDTGASFSLNGVVLLVIIIDPSTINPDQAAH